jgi:intracellular sulfur oxidation DsrE/DsrF family protein
VDRVFYFWGFPPKKGPGGQDRLTSLEIKRGERSGAMKKVLVGLIGGLLLWAQGSTVRAEDAAKDVKHKVVVEVNFEGQDQWEAVLHNVYNLKKALAPDGGVRVEIVTLGKGVGILQTKDADIVARLKALADAGDEIGICNNTCVGRHIEKKDLASYVTIVDSGVAEVVRREEQGWSYLKGGF